MMPHRVQDSGRQAVYHAEHQVWKAVERAAAGGTVDFFGSQLSLPAERRFSSIEEIQAAVDLVFGSSDVQGRWAGIAAPRVRHRAGQSQAHYEPASAVIAIPTDTGWAMRELVVLHECAHHVVRFWLNGAGKGQEIAAHGEVFIAVYLQLVSWIIGAEVGLLLRAAFDGQGIVVRGIDEVMV